MNKIGIISLNTHTYFHNYGAILHSFAFQMFLNKHEIDNEYLDYVPPMLENWDLDCPWKSLFSQHKKRGFIKYLILQKPYKIRKNKIDNFIKRNMNLSNEIYNHQKLSDASLPYKIMICESDVIWSNGFFDDAYFMALDSMHNMRKIAYAPSMADCKLTDDKIEKLPSYLDGIDYISGRESYECQFLRQYTNKDIQHVCDPVLLLDAEDYSPYIAPRMIKEQYIILYLPADNNLYLRKCAKEYAKKRKIKIIEIDSKLNIKLSHKCIITAGVEEFLSLIKYSEACFTNSFHAVCFSIIFKRELYVFTRSTKGKCEDILSKLGMENRFFEDNYCEQKLINYIEVENRLNCWKKDSQEWVLNAIKGCADSVFEGEG